MKDSIRCCISCILPCGALDVIRIVHASGRVEEIGRTVSAADIMQAYPKHVLRKPPSPDSSCGSKAVVLPPNALLQRGKIYFLVPAAVCSKDKKSSARPSAAASPAARRRRKKRAEDGGGGSSTAAEEAPRRRPRRRRRRRTGRGCCCRTDTCRRSYRRTRRRLSGNGGGDGSESGGRTLRVLKRLQQMIF